MCAIFGALLHDITSHAKMELANNIMAHIWRKSHQRGRDGRGFVIHSSSEAGPLSYRSVSKKYDPEFAPAIHNLCLSAVVIGNIRAEPTTEFVKEKELSDQQPYSLESWSIVHNGTIANDKELRSYKLSTAIDSSAIVEHLDRSQSFIDTVKSLQGSYAILASNSSETNRIYVAANYRPIWYIETKVGVFFASSRDYFGELQVPKMLTPYTAMVFENNWGVVSTETLYKQSMNNKALVVCSGGLDSVVAATYAQQELGMDIHLIHFLYGSRAEGPEVEAVREVADFLDAPLTLFPLNVYSKEDSPLLDPDSKVAGGEAGAEFAHEWVPARNLILLSVATAFAEARGMNTIVLGNNLEEAGAYPDNEPEFIAKFNDLLPFAVGDGKQMRVIMPVGNMMKHEIVALGLVIGAPMHLTWSCYRAGEHHCGTCGPCYMRRKAFEMNGFVDPILYEGE